MPRSKRLVLLTLSALLLALVAAVAAGCGGIARPAPRFSTDGDSFDLGTIRFGEAAERTVDFRNDGEKPLRVSIKKVRPAPNAECGCGVESYEVRPEVVEPGDAGQLAFNLVVPEGMPDMMDTMFAELETNDPDKPELTLELVFRMIPE